jgi:hypothetical protein
MLEKVSDKTFWLWVRLIQMEVFSMRIALVVFVVALSMSGFSQQSNTSPQLNPCLQPEQKQLDFWVGEWDLTWPGA